MLPLLFSVARLQRSDTAFILNSSGVLSVLLSAVFTPPSLAVLCLFVYGVLFSKVKFCCVAQALSLLFYLTLLRAGTEGVRHHVQTTY